MDFEALFNGMVLVVGLGGRVRCRALLWWGIA